MTDHTSGDTRHRTHRTHRKDRMGPGRSHTPPEGHAPKADRRFHKGKRNRQQHVPVPPAPVPPPPAPVAPVEPLVPKTRKEKKTREKDNK